MNNKLIYKKNGKKRILIMEDDIFVQNIVSKILNYSGYETVICARGEDCITQYSNSYENGMPFDLILMDYTIKNGIGGAETIRHIFDFDPSIKVILSTGYNVVDYKKQGFCDIIQKPYSAKDLLETIEKNIKIIN
jgi:DNA-binding NtrC family response regulator